MVSPILKYPISFGFAKKSGAIGSEFAEQTTDRLKKKRKKYMNVFENIKCFCYK